MIIIFFILEVFLFLKIVFLPTLVKKTSLKGLAWVKIAFLRSGSLLVLEHFFVGIADNSQFVDVNLNLVLEIFQSTQYTYAITWFNILFI